jgi:hypothetical protein
MLNQPDAYPPRGSSEPKKPPMKWFNDHPIVSSVLWILGHNKQNMAPPVDTDPDRNSMLRWKDDHGGRIAEYILEVQGKSSSSKAEVISTLNATESEMKIPDSSPQLKPKVSNTREHERDREVGGFTHDVVIEGKTYNRTVDETAPSPQWGFYVPITPTEYAMYSRTPGGKDSKSTTPTGQQMYTRAPVGKASEVKK